MTDPITESIRRYPGVNAPPIPPTPLDYAPTAKVYKPRRGLKRAIKASLVAALIVATAIYTPWLLGVAVVGYFGWLAYATIRTGWPV
jgi:uncharacterized membrane protein YdbT with pleckstrin-like domain